MCISCKNFVPTLAFYSSCKLMSIVSHTINNDLCLPCFQAVVSFVQRGNIRLHRFKTIFANASERLGYRIVVYLTVWELLCFPATDNNFLNLYFYYGILDFIFHFIAAWFACNVGHAWENIASVCAALDAVSSASFGSVQQTSKSLLL